MAGLAVARRLGIGLAVVEAEAEQGWVKAVLWTAGHSVAVEAGRLGIGLAVVESEYAVAQRLDWLCCG